MLIREGSRHSIFQKGNRKTQVPRHNEIVDELARKMEANAYLQKHPEEACPAKWKSGGKTLTPSAAMVGKVYEAMQA